MYSIVLQPFFWETSTSFLVVGDSCVYSPFSYFSFIPAIDEVFWSVFNFESNDLAISELGLVF